MQRRIPVGWRNVVSQPQLTRFEVAGEDVEVRWHGGRDGYRSAEEGVSVVEAGPDAVVLEVDGVRRRLARRGQRRPGRRRLGAGPWRCGGCRGSPTRPTQVAHRQRCSRRCPASVVSIAVEAGAEVAAGQPLLVLEAMKMQHTVAAPHDGVVTEIAVAVGTQVAAGAVLAVVDQARPTSTARPTTKETR